MTKFYTKADDGQYTEATKEQLEETWRERSDNIVSEKLARRKDKYMAEVRAEAEPKIREELTKELTEQIGKEKSEEFQGKLDELQHKLTESETKLRRKTIAAEYGFKTEVEEFLGNGSDEEMRAKADKLKDGFAASGKPSGVSKQTTNPSDSHSFITLTK